MTLEQVAESLACTKAQLSKLERGHIRLNDEWLDRLSYIFRCSVHDLIDDDVPEVSLIKRLEGDAAENVPFATARMIGTIAASSEQSGLVSYLDSEEQYPIHFFPPAVNQALKRHHVHYFALTVKGNAFPLYPEGSQFIFASSVSGLETIVAKDSVVLCSLKNDRGEYSGDFVRVIEYQGGIPHAVLRLRQARNITATIANTMLLGELTMSERIRFLAENERNIARKAQRSRSIPLCNSELDITAVLVKVVVDK